MWGAIIKAVLKGVLKKKLKEEAVKGVAKEAAGKAVGEAAGSAAAESAGEAGSNIAGEVGATGMESGTIGDASGNVGMSILDSSRNLSGGGAPQQAAAPQAQPPQNTGFRSILERFSKGEEGGMKKFGQNLKEDNYAGAMGNLYGMARKMPQGQPQVAPQLQPLPAQQGGSPWADIYMKYGSRRR